MSIDQFHLNNFIDSEPYHPKERRGRFLITHYNNPNQKLSKKKRFTIHVLEHESNAMRKSPSFEVFVEPLPRRRELNKSISDQQISNQLKQNKNNSQIKASSDELLKEKVWQYFNSAQNIKKSEDKEDKGFINDDLISF